MKQDTTVILPGTIIEQTAVQGKNGYEHFGIHPITASVYGHKEGEIVNLKMIVSKNQERPIEHTPTLDIDYWGWYDFRTKKFSLIYGKYFLLNMCFPSGIKSSEEFNQGKAYRLEIDTENENK